MIVRRQVIFSYTRQSIKLSSNVTSPTQVPLPDSKEDSKRETSMSPLRFESAVPASEGRRPTTYSVSELGSV